MIRREEALLSQRESHAAAARMENKSLMEAREAPRSPRQDPLRKPPMPPGYAEDALYRVMMSAFKAFDHGASGRIASWDFDQVRRPVARLTCPAIFSPMHFSFRF